MNRESLTSVELWLKTGLVFFGLDETAADTLYMYIEKRCFITVRI